VIRNNTASSYGGAALLYYENVSILNSEFSGNTATTSVGGGIYVYSTGATTVTDCMFRNNTAASHGGAISAARHTTNIYAGQPNDITITGTTIIDNITETNGGGIYLSSGTHVTLISSLVADNIAGKGGGIYVNAASPLDIYNSTISGNKAETASVQTSANEGGGIYHGGSRGMTITNSTITDNTAYRGGGLRATLNYATIHNTIIANNTASAFAQGYDVYGPVITSSSNNLIGINTGFRLELSRTDTIDRKSVNECTSYLWEIAYQHFGICEGWYAQGFHE